MAELLALLKDQAFFEALGGYLAVVISVQLLWHGARWVFGRLERWRRLRVGLDEQVLAGPDRWLRRQRAESLLDALVLLASILLTPLLLFYLANGEKKADHGELIAAFLLLLLWVAFAGTDLLKAFLGGVFFRLLLAFNRALQRGDRVVLKEIAGRVEGVGIFHVELRTDEDRKVSIPTSSLWGEVLTSVSAGRRSSLCVLHFFLSPRTTPEHRKKAQQIIRNVIQTSPYFDPSRRLRLFVAQEQGTIRLTGQAHVANTYQEAELRTDVVTRALDALHEHGIPIS